MPLCLEPVQIWQNLFKLRPYGLGKLSVRLAERPAKLLLAISSN